MIWWKFIITLRTAYKLLRISIGIGLDTKTFCSKSSIHNYSFTNYDYFNEYSFMKTYLHNVMTNMRWSNNI